jgi:hypothetical protein
MSDSLESPARPGSGARYLGRIPAVLAAAALVALSLAACAGASGPPAAVSTPPTPTPVAPVPPTGTSSPVPASSSLTVSLTDASVARYRVKEQLLRLNLPSDAVGVTERVEGKITFNADGTIDSERSKITVNLASLDKR